jgi:alpha 1,2-mannosyltransferase
LDWLRSKEYLDYFNALDRQGGFYYERWGDAPIHSIAAGLLLKKEQLHFWEEIAYFHMPFTHCPRDEQLRKDLQCSCDPSGNFDWKGFSCKSSSRLSPYSSTNLPYLGLSRYYKTNDMPLPPGVDDYSWLAILGMLILFGILVSTCVIAANPWARNQALLKGQHLYLQSQTFWDRYQKEKLEWERERLARSL